MNATEKEAWKSFGDVVHQLLGNKKDENYKKIVERMLTAFQAQGCNMSLKVHFLHSHIEEQGEKFQQNMLTIEKRYQVRYESNMIGDF